MANPKLQQENKPATKQHHLIGYSENYEGPLPHPWHLAEYEKISPGAAEKIITMAQEQAKHRQFLEKEVIESNIKKESRGMNYAFTLTIVMMLIGAFLLYNNKPTAGYFALFSPAIFQAGAFIYKKRTEEKSPEDHEKDSQK